MCIFNITFSLVKILAIYLFKLEIKQSVLSWDLFKAWALNINQYATKFQRTDLHVYTRLTLCERAWERLYLDLTAVIGCTPREPPRL